MELVISLHDYGPGAVASLLNPDDGLDMPLAEGFGDDADQALSDLFESIRRTLTFNTFTP